MGEGTFKLVVSALGAIFAVVFVVLCIPPLMENPDVIAAAMAGFVNPFSSGYALDTIFCWLVLSSWVIYEAKVAGIRHGWVCILLGIAPGVATGFAAYLLLRIRQQTTNHSKPGTAVRASKGSGNAGERLTGEERPSDHLSRWSSHGERSRA